MAESFTGPNVPNTLVFTLADANAVEVNIMSGSRGCHVLFEGTPGKLAFEGADGAAQVAKAITIPADAWHWFPCRGNDVPVIYLSGTAAGVVNVMVVEDK